MDATLQYFILNMRKPVGSRGTLDQHLHSPLWGELQNVSFWDVGVSHSMLRSHMRPQGETDPGSSQWCTKGAQKTGFKLKQGRLRMDMRRHFFTGWTAKQQSGLPESAHCYSLKFFRFWLDQSLTDPAADPLEQEVGMEISEAASNLIIMWTYKTTSVKCNSCSINIWQLH